MIERRMMIAGGLGGLAALLAPRPALALLVAPRPAPGIPASGRLGFDVVRGTRHLGTHQLTFRRTDDALTVEVLVDLVFKLGPVTLYRYHLHATERWAGGDVAGLECQTDDNGKRYKVTAQREAGALMVHGPGTLRYTAPANALPATHWNRRELDGPWINPQNGELLRPRVAPRGLATIPAAGSAKVRARHFALSGPVTLDMWYDEGDQWPGLAFTKGGAEVRYLRQT